jgi:hypothetical protein
MRGWRGALVSRSRSFMRRALTDVELADPVCSTAWAGPMWGLGCLKTRSSSSTAPASSRLLSGAGAAARDRLPIGESRASRGGTAPAWVLALAPAVAEDAGGLRRARCEDAAGLGAGVVGRQASRSRAGLWATARGSPARHLLPTAPRDPQIYDPPRMSPPRPNTPLLSSKRVRIRSRRGSHALERASRPGL